MPDSLRDQLIAAGFDAPKKEARKKPKPGGNSGSEKHSRKKQSGTHTNKKPGAGKARKTQAGAGNHNTKNSKNSPAKNKADSDAKIEQRKKLKAQIKVLIDENKTEAWKGETVYRYLVDKKIRELYVTEELHPKLTAREVAITRYNGETFIVPRDTGKAIKAINPQWSVFNLEEDEKSTDQTQQDGEYANYQVPDDLQW